MKVLLVGGSGYFGRALAADLLRNTDCQIVLAGRNRSGLQRALHILGRDRRLETCVLDLRAPETVAPALSEVRVAICAAGPFQRLPPTLARLCIEHGVHYVDLADDRGFVMQVGALAARATHETAICSGWSAVPALSGLLVRLASRDMERIDSIHVQIAPGNRAPREAGTVSSLLSVVGQPFQVRANEGWRTVRGWSEPRRFAFPPPIGPRTGYLVDVPDHELFPVLFGATRVEFRVGAELTFLNHGLSALAGLARRGMVRDWTGWTHLFRATMASVGWLGNEWGAVGVEVLGSTGAGRLARRATVMAERQGHRIAVMPAAVMAAELLAGRVSGGLIQVDGWLELPRLEEECRRRGYRVIVEEVA